MSLEKYAQLTGDIEMKLNEAGKEADSTDVRYTHDEIISKVKARISGGSLS